MAKEYKITEEVLNATLNYLAQRPFVEVFKLVEALQKSEELPKKEVKKWVKTIKKGFKNKKSLINLDKMIQNKVLLTKFKEEK